MAMVTKKLMVGQKPTEQQLKEIADAKNRPIAFDEDCPELSEEQLREFKPVHPEYRRPVKEEISLEVDSDVMNRLRNDGGDWKVRVNEILRAAVFGIPASGV